MSETAPRIFLIPGERTRCYVQSDAGHPPYLVDLTARVLNGQCDCPHFKIKLQRYLDSNPSFQGKLRCKHIKWSRDWFADNKLKEIMEDDLRL